MKKMIGSFLMFVAVSSIAFPVSAHMLWVNLYESFAHPPGHVIASIGWGHTVPLDDLPGALKLESYELIGPDHGKTALQLPLSEERDDFLPTPTGLQISSGDLGIRKFTLEEKSKPGTYQVSLVSADNYFSLYLDEEGRKKWAPKAMDELENATQVLAGMKYKSCAKAYFTLGGEWTQPEPLHNDLELLPLTDLSDVRVGDLVKFRVTLLGDPLSTTPEKGLEYLTANSNTFGGPDKFFLASMLHKGEAQFRMPAAGQWVVNIYTSYDVDPENGPEELIGKCTKVFYSGTVSFHVKP